MQALQKELHIGVDIRARDESEDGYEGQFEERDQRLKFAHFLGILNPKELIDLINDMEPHFGPILAIF